MAQPLHSCKDGIPRRRIITRRRAMLDTFRRMAKWGLIALLIELATTSDAFAQRGGRGGAGGRGGGVARGGAVTRGGGVARGGAVTRGGNWSGPRGGYYGGNRGGYYGGYNGI